MKFLKFIAVITGKAAIVLSRIAGNQGTDFPGRIARKIYPPILSESAGDIKREIIIITGTNGKTTTSNMIAEIIRENGCSLVHNTEGANLLTGITTAFIPSASLFGRCSCDYALLETDEANVPLLLQEIQPQALLVTNFFRDQLDRYGELDNTIRLIRDAIKGKKDLELVLNADDPLLADFERYSGLKSWYYGFDDTAYDEFAGNNTREGRYCVLCGHELDYERYHYAQLGKYHCPACDNHNPDRDFTGHDLKMTPEISFKINEMEITSPYQGFYNAYNILAAVSMGKRLSIDDEVIQRAIMNYRPRAGRMEKFFINGKPCLLVLVKNPAGFNQILNMMTQDPARKGLFIALNDNAADGRDISWIWDTEAEIIARAEAGVAEVVCAGQRSGDMALRIKYAGFAPEYIRIISGLQAGIEQTLEIESETAYILCTYTALFECRKILIKMQHDSDAVPEYRRSGARNY
ncbi:MAG: Mur ligase family protein [Syntrophomonadaceae bacterium]|nr:Mur ligase family protein [Syntrophomonadaceae bacterium]